jgi:hypothetical protein
MKNGVSSKSVLRVYVKRQNVTIIPSNLNWGEYSCAQPLRPSPDKSGKARMVFPTDQQIVIDAATRAGDQMGVPLEIIDLRDLGVFKRMRLKYSKSIPWIEFMGKVLEGSPTTKEIVEFISNTCHENEKD